MQRWMSQQKTPTQIRGLIASRRKQRRKNRAAPDITTIRRALKGDTYRRNTVETRGRERVYTRADVMAMEKARKKLIKEAKGAKEVHWGDLITEAGVPEADATTVARSFEREGLDVKWRPARQKPQRQPEHEQERYKICKGWRHLPKTYFADTVDLIIDNHYEDVATDERARVYLQKQRVRGHLRTPAEGLKKGFTKPNKKKHRINPGGGLHICAGISNCKVVLWEYIEGRWNGAKAAALYKGPIYQTLQKHRGPKSRYIIVEDNDPAGYKSGKGKKAKREVGIKPKVWPRYSPDLNPLDFFLWENITDRMEASAPSGHETIDELKKRMRRVALRTPKAVIRKAILQMSTRIQKVYEEKGGDIDID